MAINLLDAKNEYELAFLQLCKESAVEIPMEAIVWPKIEDYYFPYENSNKDSRCTLTVNTEAGYKHGEKNKITIRWKMITGTEPEKLWAMVPKYVFEEYVEDEDEIILRVREHVRKYWAHPLDEYSSKPRKIAGAVKFDFDKSAIIRHWKNSTPEFRYWEVPYDMPPKPVDGKDLTDLLKEDGYLSNAAFTVQTLVDGVPKDTTE